MKFKQKHKAAALVIGLALIVLISGIVIAFFSLATADRRVEVSRANRAKADLLVESGGAHAINVLLQEIADPNASEIVTTNHVSIYRPRSSANAVPARQISSTINLADPACYSLIRQSIPGADTYANAHRTSDPARNGRKLDPARWNAPALLTGNGFTQSDQLPNWIYVDRRNGLTTTPSVDTIGRFAYNIYDIGGLLNANIVGGPAGLSPAQISYLKGGQGGADLTQLTTQITQTDITQLAAFRYPDNPAADNYVGRILGAVTNGLLSVDNFDYWTRAAFKQNMFCSRQDLIRYARTQNTKFQQALPFLTHFSQSVNAPSWKPAATPVNTNPDLLNIRFSASSAVDHYDDAGVRGSYNVRAGEPLLQRRFSLAKLSWITPTGPAPGISAEAIQACFGLRWLPAEERWNYVGPSGSTLLGSIRTLSEIASETVPREPNFFELLKAGILDATLGGAALGKTGNLSDPNLGNRKAMSACAEGNIDLDANEDLHILKIGANILDCADPDNYPVILAMDAGGTVIEKAGVEDLPYFYSMDAANIRVMTPLTPAETIANPGKTHWLNSSDFVWVPELFNPHRASTTSSGPASVQIGIADGILRQVGYGTNGSLSPTISASPVTPITLPPINIPSASFDSFRSSPKPVRDAAASNRLGVTVPSVDSAIQDVQAFRVYSYATDFAGLLPKTIQADGKRAAAEVSRLILRMQYMTPQNRLKTYLTLGGNENLPLLTGVNGFYRMDFEFNILFHSNTLAALPTNTSFRSPALIAWDPRSSRFGPGYSQYMRAIGDAPNFTSNGNTRFLGARLFYPKEYFLADSTSFVGAIPQMPAFQDYDSVARIPDGGLNYNSATPGVSTAANPYGNLTDLTRRPVLLQRPFRNVAELGCVFRDIPWQTLNLFNNQSGDAALLDFFSVLDEPSICADRVNLASRHPQVLQALVAGTPQEVDGTLPWSTVEANNLAAAFATYSFSGGQPAATLPRNVAELTGFMSSNAPAVASLSPIKNRREAVARSLGSTQTRTWNVLIDLVAQSGRFPRSAAGSADFQVEAESRVWTSAAIDRYTARVVGLQNEKVNE